MRGICLFYQFYVVSYSLKNFLKTMTSIAQLVRALHRNRRSAGSTPARGPIVAIFGNCFWFIDQQMYKMGFVGASFDRSTL